MSKQIFVLLFALGWAIQVDSAGLTPDVVAEAQVQLDQLRETVLYYIRSAENAFVDLNAHIVHLGAHTRSGAEQEIDQVHETVSAELATVREAAAGKDISYCTSGREQMIHKLPTELKERVYVCLDAKNIEAKKILNDARYVVDVMFTRVHQLQHQLGLCEDGSCVSSVVGQIEGELVQLPQKIKLEVNKVTQLLGSSRLSVQSCGEKNVADFTGYVTSLLEQISVCVDRILS